MFYADAPGLAAALQRILDQPELAANLRTTATARADEAYSWDDIADAYERWLRGLAA